MNYQKGCGGGCLTLILGGVLALVLREPIMYVGYNITTEEEQVLGETVGATTSIRTEATQHPSSFAPTLGLKVTERKTESRVVQVASSTYHDKVYGSYEGSEDFFEFIALFLAPLDLPLRFCGTSFMEWRGHYEPPSHLGLLGYLANLVRWFGYFAPGVNSYPGDPLRVERVLASTETRDGGLQQEHHDRSAPGKRLALDLGPAGQTTVESDDAGLVQVDLRPFLDCLTRDYTWRIAVTAEDSPASTPLELSYETNALGVTWDKPKAPSVVPAALRLALVLEDAGGNALLDPGEQATATLTVENVGTQAAYGLRAKWSVPEADADQLRLTSSSTPDKDKLDPEETWTATLSLQADAEWDWPETLAISASVSDVSVPDREAVAAEIAARSFDPPRLDLVRTYWSDGNDGVLAPGDLVTLRLYVQNLGLNPAKEVRVRLRSEDVRLVLSTPMDQSVAVEPAKSKEFLWNLVIPADWESTAPGGGLPIEVSVEEARPKYANQFAPLGLALGDRSEAVSSAAQLAAMAEAEMAIEQAHNEILASYEAVAKLEKERLAARQKAEEKERQLEAEQEKARQAATLASQRLTEQQARTRQEQDKVASLTAREEEKRTALENKRRELEAKRTEQQEERSQLRARSYALIIGIDDYDDPDIVDLEYPVADARALKDALTGGTTGLFAPENVTLLTSDHTDASRLPTRENVLESLVNLSRHLDEDDRLLLFFAGHGATDENGNGNYLMAKNTKLGLEKYQGLKLSEEILDLLESCPAQRQIVLVDACHSGFRKGQRSGRNIGVVAAQIDSALETFSKSGAGRAVLASCSRDEVSNESPALGHGVFTYYLIQGLTRFDADGIPEAARDANQRVETGELFEYVRTQVEKWCRDQGRPRQRPRASFDDTGMKIPLAMYSDAE